MRKLKSNYSLMDGLVGLRMQEVNATENRQTSAVECTETGTNVLENVVKVVLNLWIEADPAKEKDSITRRLRRRKRSEMQWLQCFSPSSPFKQNKCCISSSITNAKIVTK